MRAAERFARLAFKCTDTAGSNGAQLGTLRLNGLGSKGHENNSPGFTIDARPRLRRSRAPASLAVHWSKLRQPATIEEPAKPMRPACKGMLLKISRENPATPNPPWTAIDAGAPARTEPSPTYGRSH